MVIPPVTMQIQNLTSEITKRKILVAKNWLLIEEGVRRANASQLCLRHAHRQEHFWFEDLLLLDAYRRHEMELVKRLLAQESVWTLEIWDFELKKRRLVESQSNQELRFPRQTRQFTPLQVGLFDERVSSYGSENRLHYVTEPETISRGRPLLVTGESGNIPVRDLVPAWQTATGLL